MSGPFGTAVHLPLSIVDLPFSILPCEWKMEIGKWEMENFAANPKNCIDNLLSICLLSA
jgi:hypothetical protein